MRYELGFHIPEDILHSHGREKLKSYIALTDWVLQRRLSVSPVKYELGFHIPEDDILQSHGRENLKSYIALTDWALRRRSYVSPMRYELGFHIPEDILHSHRRVNVKSYIVYTFVRQGLPQGHTQMTRERGTFRFIPLFRNVWIRKDAVRDVNCSWS
jgi:hypothetical protein